MIHFRWTAIFSSILLPLSASAELKLLEAEGFKNVSDFIFLIATIVGLFIPIIITLVIVAYFWGGGQFILKSGDKEGITKGKQILFWGAIAIFVLFSIWGIIAFLQTFFPNFTLIGVPQLKGV